MGRRALAVVALAGCAAPAQRWYGEVSGGAVRLPDGQQELRLTVDNPGPHAAALSVLWTIHATSSSAPVALTLSGEGFSAGAGGQGELTLAGQDSLRCEREAACAFRYTFAAAGEGHSRIPWGGSARIDWDTLAGDTAALGPTFSLQLGATTQ